MNAPLVIHDVHRSADVPAQHSADGVASVLDEFEVPLFDPTNWNDSEVDAVADRLRRLRAQVEHGEAVLCSRMDSHGRDANARVARAFGCTSSSAARLRQLSDLVMTSAQVSACLRAGLLSESHVRALRIVADEPVETLDRLALSGVGLTQPEFENVLKEHLIRKDDGVELRARQKRVIGFRFGTDSLGLTTMNAKLLPEDGLPLQAMIEHITNQRWRAEHPARSAVFEPLVGDQSFAYRSLEVLKELLSSHVAGFSGGQGRSSEGTDAGENSVFDSGGYLQKSNGIEVAKSERATFPNSPRAAVLVVIDADSGSAEIVGQGPVPAATATQLLRHNADLFVATRSRLDDRTMGFGLCSVGRVRRASKLYKVISRWGRSDR